MFKDSADWSIAYWSDFKTKSEFDSWMSDRLSEGLVYIGEEGKQEKVYPQVLSLDLKGPFGGYRTTVQSFSSAEDYNKYEQDQLWNGYKIIGSEPYKKFNDAENR
jgi:hypothetical protein